MKRIVMREGLCRSETKKEQLSKKSIIQQSKQKSNQQSQSNLSCDIFWKKAIAVLRYLCT